MSVERIPRVLGAGRDAGAPSGRSAGIPAGPIQAQRHLDTL